MSTHTHIHTYTHTQKHPINARTTHTHTCTHTYPHTHVHAHRPARTPPRTHTTGTHTHAHVSLSPRRTFQTRLGASTLTYLRGLAVADLVASLVSLPIGFMRCYTSENPNQVGCTHTSHTRTHSEPHVTLCTPHPDARKCITNEVTARIPNTHAFRTI